MDLIPVLSTSILFQIAAVVLALRLIAITGRMTAWLALAAAAFLMVVRRGLALVELLAAPEIAAASMGQESVALVISVLLAVGLWLITPVFREREERAERLAESEARLRAVMEKMPDGIGLLVEDEIAEVNAAVEELLGYPRDEIVGEDPVSFIHPDDRARTRARMRALRSGDEEEPGRYRMLRSDGSVVWVEIFSRAMEHEGRPAIISIFRDLTPRMKADAERERLVTAVEQATDAIMVTDAAGVIKYVNPSFERITGFSRDEAVGATPALLSSGEHDEAFYRELWETITRGDVWKGRVTNRRKDGELYQEEMTITPVREASGSIVNFVAVKRDVTRERELEAQLARAQRLEAVGQLTGSIAHDFNNLLTVVRSNADLLADGIGGAPGELREYLRDLRGAATRGARLIRKLLAFSRRERLSPEPIDLAETVRGFTSTLRHVLPSSVEVELEIDDGTPTVLADSGAVEQIVVNLATNARDAMGGEGPLTIAVGGETVPGSGSGEATRLEPGEYGTLEVRDAGAGMDEDTLDRVFDPFFTTKSPEEGTGLGMAVTYGLVKQLGGHIELDSTPGEGTRVRVFLPATELEAADVETVAPEPSRVEPDGTGTVLIIDDEPEVRRVARRVLRRLGYDVLVASDGEGALEVVREHADDLDLVVTDIVMPRLGGQGLYERLREEHPELPVLFMSGYAKKDVGGGGELDDSVPFLPKPWTVEELAGAVADAIGGGRG